MQIFDVSHIEVQQVLHEVSTITVISIFLILSVAGPALSAGKVFCFRRG